MRTPSGRAARTCRARRVRRLALVTRARNDAADCLRPDSRRTIGKSSAAAADGGPFAAAARAPARPPPPRARNGFAAAAPPASVRALAAMTVSERGGATTARGPRDASFTVTSGNIARAAAVIDRLHTLVHTPPPMAGRQHRRDAAPTSAHRSTASTATTRGSPWPGRSVRDGPPRRERRTHGPRPSRGLAGQGGLPVACGPSTRASARAPRINQLAGLRRCAAASGTRLIAATNARACTSWRLARSYHVAPMLQCHSRRAPWRALPRSSSVSCEPAALMPGFPRARRR